MDSIFVEGIAATVSAVLIFCGSVWLLLTLVLGPRLAYFVTATITLAFLLFMGAVWSYGEPLGPVGEQESYTSLGIAESPADIGFGPAADYPDDPWFEADTEDDAQVSIKTGAEGAATNELEKAIEAEEITVFTNVAQAQVDSESTRLYEQNGTFYGAVRFEPAPALEEEEGGDAEGEEGGDAEEDVAAAEDDPKGGEGGGGEDAEAEAQGPPEDAEVIIVLEQDPGNKSGKARIITAGFLALFVVHLAGLSWSEKRARRVP